MAPANPPPTAVEQQQQHHREPGELATLPEPELDLLISLKTLTVTREDAAGHHRLADVFDPRTLRALGSRYYLLLLLLRRTPLLCNPCNVTQTNLQVVECLKLVDCGWCCRFFFAMVV